MRPHMRSSDLGTMMRTSPARAGGGSAAVLINSGHEITLGIGVGIKFDSNNYY
jgi:hypothetical protein